MAQQQMTVSEALKAGYEFAMLNGDSESITPLDSVEIEEGDEWLLMEKDPIGLLLTEKELNDGIHDGIVQAVEDRFGYAAASYVSEHLTKTIQTLDLNAFAKSIYEATKEGGEWMKVSDIGLIADPSSDNDDDDETDPQPNQP